MFEVNQHSYISCLVISDFNYKKTNIFGKKQKKFKYNVELKQTKEEHNQN